MSIDVLRNPSDAEPKIFLSGALALFVHILFIVMMVFGLSWKNDPPEGMVVELWSELPKPISEPVAPTKPSKPSPPPEPIKPKPVEPPKHQEQVKPEPVKLEPTKPAPEKPTAAPKDITPPVKKPDIEIKQKPESVKEVKPDLEELKKKEEAEKIKKLEEQKQELEKKKALEQQKEAEKQKELQKQKELAAQKQKEQEAREAKARREAETQKAAQQAAARKQVAGEIEKYKAMIQAKIRSRTVMPPDLPGNPKVEFIVTLLPGGDILDVRLSKSSGHAVFDSTVERAIFLSKPLPLPPDPALFKEFRVLKIEVHYRE